MARSHAMRLWRCGFRGNTILNTSFVTSNQPVWNHAFPPICTSSTVPFDVQVSDFDSTSGNDIIVPFASHTIPAYTNTIDPGTRIVSRGSPTQAVRITSGTNPRTQLDWLWTSCGATELWHLHQWGSGLPAMPNQLSGWGFPRPFLVVWLWDLHLSVHLRSGHSKPSPTDAPSAAQTAGPTDQPTATPVASPTSVAPTSIAPTATPTTPATQPPTSTAAPASTAPASGSPTAQSSIGTAAPVGQSGTPANGAPTVAPTDGPTAAVAGAASGGGGGFTLVIIVVVVLVVLVVLIGVAVMRRGQRGPAHMRQTLLPARSVATPPDSKYEVPLVINPENHTEEFSKRGSQPSVQIDAGGYVAGPVGRSPAQPGAAGARVVLDDQNYVQPPGIAPEYATFVA
eukprot:m.468099 g.468099  ORF g.468099 m.468099 type:complete len:398 (-) comp27181_c0_seq1:57-1250(-)